jgi:hypothetical protein
LWLRADVNHAGMMLGNDMTNTRLIPCMGWALTCHSSMP